MNHTEVYLVYILYRVYCTGTRAWNYYMYYVLYAVCTEVQYWYIILYSEIIYSTVPGPGTRYWYQIQYIGRQIVVEKTKKIVAT